MFQGESESLDPASEEEMKRFQLIKVAGKGTFGTVHLARDQKTGAQVAIKRVIQDPRFRNREHSIIKKFCEIRHPNIVNFISSFFTVDSKTSTVSLNLVMEFMPSSLYRSARDCAREGRCLPEILTKVYCFQLIRSIAFLQLKCLNITHRDIKLHNILVDDSTGILKLCDFGSSKKLLPTEANVAYMCSRYYRAPELIFGNQYYTPAVDMWSVGCVFGEMMSLQPIFVGKDNEEQLKAIISIMGPLTKEEHSALQKNGTLRFPYNQTGQRKPWKSVLQGGNAQAYDLLDSMLRYDPEDRVKPFDALCHPYFADLRDPGMKLPGGNSLPASLFKFLPEEIAEMTPSQRTKLLGE